MRINFHEAVNGCEKEISYMGKLPCPTCHGSGAAAGSKAKKCPRCNGQGIVRPSCRVRHTAPPTH